MRGCVKAATRPSPERCKFRSGKGSGDAVTDIMILVEDFTTAVSCHVLVLRGVFWIMASVDS